MRITQNQILELYKFTRKHYVEHYDLQTELVDHLANGIERQWAQYPNLSFEEAKQKEFQKFGVFGFMDVVAERQKAMGRKYRRILWGFFKDWWSMPKIMATLSSILIVYGLINGLPKGDLRFGAIAGVFFSLALLFFYRAMRLRKEMEGVSKKWMLQEMIYRQGLAVQLFILPIHFLNIGNTWQLYENFYAQMFLSILIVVLGLLFKICGYIIPSKAEELLMETYPEYKFT